ncbi:MAG: hypothetical protein ACRD4F_09355 [Candidatus Angelobacter sp.]
MRVCQFRHSGNRNAPDDTGAATGTTLFILAALLALSNKGTKWSFFFAVLIVIVIVENLRC